MKTTRISQRTEGTVEIGYIFTFLLGVVLPTSFSLWAWDIETATRDRWSREALNHDIDELASAVERAEQVASVHPDARFAEPVDLLLHDASGLGLRIVLSEETIRIVALGDSDLDTSRKLSGASSATHEGEVRFENIERIWVVLDGGIISVSNQAPDF